MEKMLSWSYGCPFRYFKTAITTPVNRKRLTTLKHLHTMSLDVKPEGAIKSAQIHTPITQLIDMSADERRRTILTIKGMLNKGMMTDAASPMFSKAFMKSLFGI
jgi:hypothetical protein